LQIIVVFCVESLKRKEFKVNKLAHNFSLLNFLFAVKECGRIVFARCRK
jgi:hypothetical protein